MKSTRKAFGEFLVEKAAKDENIVVVDADLSTATCTTDFARLFPNRHFDVGIAEQDLVGFSAGLALSGKTVFATTFAMFLAGRAYEQIRNTVAYSNININLCATHTGLAVGEDGASHQCIEDIALMNTIPNMKIFCPADDISTKQILNECLKISGPKYIRLGRNSLRDVYSMETNFKLGCSNIFGNGTDGTIFAIGSTLNIALDAKSELKKHGIDVRVVDLYSIKPVDKDIIIESAMQTDKLVSIEDHNIISGIGSIISNVLTEYYPKKLYKLGVNDRFGKSGSIDKLYKMYNITKEDIMKIFLNNK